jgi:serine/threonine protein kinase
MSVTAFTAFLRQILQVGKESVHIFFMKHGEKRAASPLQGLNYIHSRDPPIVHRDVKPSNVLVFPLLGVTFPILKLTDFGVSTETPAPNSLAGTGYYLSPEMQARQPYDAKTDIYSTGVLAAVMVCLEGPRGMEGGTVVGKVLGQFYPNMHDFLTKCLEREPANRPTALQALELLDAASAAGPIRSVLLSAK